MKYHNQAQGKTNYPLLLSWKVNATVYSLGKSHDNRKRTTWEVASLISTQVTHFRMLHFTHSTWLSIYQMMKERRKKKTFKMFRTNLWLHQGVCVLYLTSLVFSRPLLWFCRKRQPSFASLWTISSLDRSSLSWRMHMLPCCSAGGTENMYLKPQSHDIAWSTANRLLWVSSHCSRKKCKRRWELKKSVSNGVCFCVCCPVKLERPLSLQPKSQSPNAPVSSAETHAKKSCSVWIQVSLCARIQLEWMTDSLSSSSLAFHRWGGERVRDTVCSGNIWWARQSQKRKFQTSQRKRESTFRTGQGVFYWKVRHLLG